MAQRDKRFVAQVMISLAMNEKGRCLYDEWYSEYKTSGMAFQLPRSWLEEVPRVGTYSFVYSSRTPHHDHRRRIAEDVLGWRFMPPMLDEGDGGDHTEDELAAILHQPSAAEEEGVAVGRPSPTPRRTPISRRSSLGGAIEDVVEYDAEAGRVATDVGEDEEKEFRAAETAAVDAIRPKGGGEDQGGEVADLFAPRPRRVQAAAGVGSEAS